MRGAIGPLRGTGMLLLTLLVGACTPSPGSEMSQDRSEAESSGSVDEATAAEAPSIDTLRGTVLYREQMMPPSGSVLTVVLEDISRADAPVVELARTEIPLETGPPYTFALPYESTSIDGRMRYTLRARIRSDDRLLWTSTEHIPPFARPEDPPIEIMLTRSGG